MILISHRGNIEGKNVDFENKPGYIDLAIINGFDVEVDLWYDYQNKKIWLGHDKPEWEVSSKWLNDRKLKLWIHCKDLISIIFMKELELNTNDGKFNYFFHNEDDCTLTSKGFIWVYPGKQPINNSIAVLPELYNDDVSKCEGICSDFIKKYE